MRYMELPARCPIHRRGPWVYVPWTITALTFVVLFIASVIPLRVLALCLIGVLAVFSLTSYYHPGCRLLERYQERKKEGN